MSRASRWPDGDTPLSGFHGGTKKAALRAVEEARARRAAREAPPPPARRDRLRPGARRAEPAFEPVPEAPRSPWACRPTDRHIQGRQGEKREGSYWDCPAELMAEQRRRLYLAQDGICALCGTPMRGDPQAFSRDHTIPRAIGGVDALGNLVLSHGDCNNRKANDTPTGCELVFLLAVNCRLGVHPMRY